MASVNYDDILSKQLQSAESEAEKYRLQRQQQADDYAAKIGQVYDDLIASANRQYTQSANDTAESYRGAYDANVVSELVARRNAKEAIANSNLQGSGLNATQNTAISLMRGNADLSTTLQKQAAVTAIMQELDKVKSQYSAQAASTKASIYDTANSDINSNYSSLRSNAYSNAASVYNSQLASEQDQPSDADHPATVTGSAAADPRDGNDIAGTQHSFTYWYQMKKERGNEYTLDALNVLREKGVISKAQFIRLVDMLNLKMTVKG